jgi:PAS domain S-box-containing protein
MNHGSGDASASTLAFAGTAAGSVPSARAADATLPPRAEGALWVDGTQMGRCVRDYPWQQTPLGPASTWPASLRTTVSLLLASRHPMFLWWGESLVNLYNDAYIPVLGGRHPAALGRSAPEVWSDVWPVVGPQAAAVLRDGRSTWNDSVLLVMERHGFTEETYFTFSYSPARDDAGRVAGVFCACTEDTARVLGERRLRTLRELASGTMEARTPHEACAKSAEVLRGSTHDLPFALVYLLESDGDAARLCGSMGFAGDHPAAARVVPVEQAAALSEQAAGEGAEGRSDGDPTWPLREAMRARHPILVEAIPGAGTLPGGPWPEPARRAVVLPLARAADERPLGFLVAGLSPRLAYDDDYRGFLTLVAGQIATAVATARRHEEAQRRAHALAELDRTKTTFFTNVSHELRTPLTLMLGPLAQMLQAAPAGETREQLALVQRNGLRLLKLVNNLLDFAALEAGRVRARFEPIDLGGFTTELASVFRSATEKAGLALVVDCPRPRAPTYVDRDMWEKVVLNLVANALKFTFAGRIEVRLRDRGAHVELEVVDTGVGIPEHELPRLFERFHRVRDTRGRTHEGTGIGLALVRELVRLHGGEVAATSRLGEGSGFTVKLPTGRAHLAADLFGSVQDTPARTTPSALASAQAEEALRWLPDADRHSLEGTLEPPDTVTGTAGLVLVADDNADMRSYLRSLLRGQYRVELAADGVRARDLARTLRPDLVIADIMMPGLDGLGLLAALRAQPALRDTPVILLSARAGEEARVEGLAAGADDYLVKPFSARELLARVEAHLQLRRLRSASQAALRASEQRLRLALQAGRLCSFDFDARTDRVVRSDNAAELFGIPGFEEGTGDAFARCVHPDDRETFRRAIKDARLRGGRYEARFRFLRPDGSVLWIQDSGQAEYDAEGRLARLRGVATDISVHKHAEEALLRATAELESVLDAIAEGIVVTDLEGRILRMNAAGRRILGYRDEDEYRLVLPAFLAAWEMRTAEGVPIPVEGWPIPRVLRGESFAGWEARVRRRGASEEKTLSCNGDLVRDAMGRAMLGLVTFRDVTALRLAEGAQRASEERLRLIYELAPVGIAECNLDGRFLNVNQTLCALTGYSREELLDRTFADITHPDDQAEDLDRFHARREQASDFSWLEKRYVRKDGSHVWVATRGYFVRDAAGTPRYAIGVALDIRERKLAEQALREADRRKDEFLAMLAHELRNPLAPMRNALEAFRLLLPPDPQLAQLRDIIDRQVGQLTRMVDDLLDVTRITMGKVRLRREPMNLVAAVERALETVEPLVTVRRHRLDFARPVRPVWVEGDEVRLTQVVANLLGNAAKYTPEGGIISVRLGADATEATVEVADNGIGIAAEMLERVFDLFEQDERALDRAEGGLGIGLTLVKKLVELHDGRVAAASAGRGRGARFTVTLPVLRAPADDAPVEARGAGGTGRGRRILVVDDNADAVESLALLLELSGHEVHRAYEGTRAVELARALRPEIALLDLGLPGLDGYAIARALRADPVTARVTLIALTGYGQPGDRDRSHAAGFDAHLVKPVDFEELQSLVAGLPTRAAPRGEDGAAASGRGR